MNNQKTPVVSPEEDQSPVDGRLMQTEEGVDLTLIRWFLSLTPGERLEYAQGFAQEIQRLRDGVTTP
jgi:hypothetical protein